MLCTGPNQGPQGPFPPNSLWSQTVCTDLETPQTSPAKCPEGRGPDWRITTLELGVSAQRPPNWHPTPEILSAHDSASNPSHSSLAQWCCEHSGAGEVTSLGGRGHGWWDGHVSFPPVRGGCGLISSGGVPMVFGVHHFQGSCHFLGGWVSPMEER